MSLFPQRKGPSMVIGHYMEAYSYIEQYYLQTARGMAPFITYSDLKDFRRPTRLFISHWISTNASVGLEKIGLIGKLNNQGGKIHLYMLSLGKIKNTILYIHIFIFTLCIEHIGCYRWSKLVSLYKIKERAIQYLTKPAFTPPTPQMWRGLESPLLFAESVPNSIRRPSANRHLYTGPTQSTVTSPGHIPLNNTHFTD